MSEEMRGCARILRGTWVQPREQWSAVAGGRRAYLRGVAIFAVVLGILGICNLGGLGWGGRFPYFGDLRGVGVISGVAKQWEAMH